MSDEETVREYIQTFRGRGDALGGWDGYARREPVSPEHFERHLTSQSKKDWIGVYPHLGSRGVSWGCIDIDGKDFPTEPGADTWDWERMHELACNLRTILDVKDVYAHIEQTRNGYHLWVFPDEPTVPAAFMRRALMAACKALSYDPKEVNPKQEELHTGKLGNFVRLPYYGFLGRRHQPDRFFINGFDDWYDLEEWLTHVRKRTSTQALQTLSQLWTPPTPKKFDGPPPKDVEGVLSVVPGLCYTIWRDGPLEGSDRSNTLLKLGYELRDAGITAPSAFTVVKDADRRWGKFYDRPDCDEQIMNIVEHVYSR